MIESYVGDQHSFFSYDEEFETYLQKVFTDLQARGKLIKQRQIAYQSFDLQSVIPQKDILWRKEKKACYTLTYFVDTKNHSLHIPVIEPDFIF